MCQYTKGLVSYGSDRINSTCDASLHYYSHPLWGGYPAGDNLTAASAQGHNANLLANLHLQSPLEKNRPAMLRLRVRIRQKEKKK